MRYNEKEDSLRYIKLQQSIIIGREILLYFLDFNRMVIPMFDKARVYRIPFQAYDKFRQKDKMKFSHEMYRLRRSGVIKKYFDKKGKFIELTKKGQDLIKKYFVEGIKIPSESRWDKKWRLVIFDIPDDKKDVRDFLRRKLESIGFLKLQESVYVFPFECAQEINAIKCTYCIEEYVQYIVADRIETEIDLLENFYDLGILDKKIIFDI